jgi:hypothetical protein
MKHCIRTHQLSLVLAGLIPSAAIPADSPWPEALFVTPQVNLPAHVQLPPRAMAKRQRQAGVRLDLIAADRVTLNLFDYTTLVAVRERIADQGQGSRVWIGHIEGAEDSEVILAVRGKALSGTVRHDGRVFEVQYAGDQSHRIQETDPARTLEGCPHLEPDEAIFGAPEDTSASAAVESASDIAAPTVDADATTIIDLMVVYTPKARANAGGTDGIEAKIANAIAAANLAYSRSGVDMQLNPVHVAEVSYTESGDMFTTLADLRGAYDGKMDFVHDWRDTYGADQVAMISADSNYCGLGYTMTSSFVNSFFSSYAFAVVHDDSRYACLSNHSFAHELGHNQGSQHNIEDGSSGGAYAYSYGHRICASSGFRTVMSYACSGAGRIGHFSNPSVYYNGDPTGVDGAADNARSLNNTRNVVAAFRANVVARPPASPAELAATGQSDSEIALSWADKSSDEDGFRVERSSDGANWSEIATLGQNVTGLTDVGLTQGTQYAYRVSAFNGSGVSGPSNIAWAETWALYFTQDITPPEVVIASPANGATLSGEVSIAVSASDDQAVQSIELRIDGQLVAFANADSLQHPWDTDGLSGQHAITASAVDAAGNTGTLTIDVTVAEAQPASRQRPDWVGRGRTQARAWSPTIWRAVDRGTDR